MHTLAILNILHICTLFILAHTFADLHIQHFCTHFLLIFAFNSALLYTCTFSPFHTFLMHLHIQSCTLLLWAFLHYLCLQIQHFCTHFLLIFAHNLAHFSMSKILVIRKWSRSRAFQCKPITRLSHSACTESDLKSKFCFSSANFPRESHR